MKKIILLSITVLLTVFISSLTFASTKYFLKYNMIDKQFTKEIKRSEIKGFSYYKVDYIGNTSKFNRVKYINYKDSKLFTVIHFEIDPEISDSCPSQFGYDFYKKRQDYYKEGSLISYYLWEKVNKKDYDYIFPGVNLNKKEDIFYYKPDIRSKYKRKIKKNISYKESYYKVINNKNRIFSSYYYDENDKLILSKHYDYELKSNMRVKKNEKHLRYISYYVYDKDQLYVKEDYIFLNARKLQIKEETFYTDLNQVARIIKYQNGKIRQVDHYRNIKEDENKTELVTIEIFNRNGEPIKEIPAYEYDEYVAQ